MPIRVRESDAGPAVDLTPVIDIVFLLLIFFLVATTFHQTEREMKVALPTASSAAPISMALKELVVNVDEAGSIIVSGKVIDAETLRSIITTAVANNPEQKVTIRGDRRVPYGGVVLVLDVCKAGGVREPFLDVVLE